MGQSAARKHFTAVSVRGEKLTVNAAVTHKLFNKREILLVVAVGAVLVFNLHGDDVAALCNLHRLQTGKQFFVKTPDGGGKVGITAPYLHIFIL